MAYVFRVLIVAVMMVSMLAACGSADSTGQTGESSPAASPAATIEASPATETSPAASAAATSAAMTAEGVELPEVDPAAVSGNVVTSGSSTVFPLTQRMAERFQEEGYTGTISVDEIGTGAGFQRFCEAGETDIANASRAIKDEETQKCAAINRAPIEFRVGTDALAVVVSKDNTFLSALTLEQLGKIYTGEFKQWSDVDASYPAEPIQIYSPGTDSGTYDYFVEEVLGGDEEKVKQFQAQNPTQSENDNVLVQGVESSPNAIGYFGYAYYLENKGRLKILALDGVEPTEETAENGEYPLARPLFIYSTASIMKEKPQVAAFISFYLTTVNDEIVDVGYFPASEEALSKARQAFLDGTK
ncbi:MAG TPA: PstS family phosphate ABC transporter substrate-binding protein [Herpetosiphonaceae bacterium]